ncbi:MAG: dockerin type I domain-containing protein [Ruminococcus sp.]
MKKTVCLFLVFILLQLSIINTTVFAKDSLSDELNDVTISENEVLNTFYKDTEARIENIKNTDSEIKPSGEGTAYYVSNNGDDNNGGLSPEEPIATISAVNRLNLKAGDVVYFERTGVWRGSIKAYTDGVSYTAYGEGSKPELYGSSHNYAKLGEWIETDVPNIYKYSEKISKDVGNIIFNNGEANGIKCVLEEKFGVTYNRTTDKKFCSYADLTDNLHFFHDSSGTKELYLYCLGGNPADLYDSIEFAEGIDIIETKWSKNITVDNLTFRYSGDFAVSAQSCNGLTVRNCEFYWIGGSIQYGSVRFGNGVQIWGEAKNFTVENCYFSQIYDAAVTFQFSGESNNEVHSDNIKFTNNVMEYCNYSIEYFLDYGKNNANDFGNFTVSGNHMWYAGYGLCSQRPDKGGDAHIKSWTSANQNTGNYHISDNLFAMAKTYLSETYSSNENQGAEYDSNTYIQFLNRYLGRNDKTLYCARFAKNVRETILQNFGDENAKIIFVSNSVQSTSSSPDESPKMIYGDADGNGKVNIKDCTLIGKHIAKIVSISDDRLALADVNEDGVTSIKDVTCIQKFIAGFGNGYGLAGQIYQGESTGDPEAYKLYIKTNLSWVTNDDVLLYAYDLSTGKSYRFEQVSNVCPYIYIAEVPGTLTDVSIYRFTGVVYDLPVRISDDGGNVYNCYDTIVSSIDNCIRLTVDGAVITEPYYEEPFTDFSLSTVYFDNSNARWSDVYIFGWTGSGLDGESVLMKNIEGTNIWYYTFESPLVVGTECFLFKDTESTWQNQTENIVVQANMNCYRANAGNKTGGLWYDYSEE